MSSRDMLRFLFQESQVDADTEAMLREAQEAERILTRKTPLEKALKGLKIDCPNIEADELGAKLTLSDAECWHDAVRKLGSIEAMNALADEGWVAEFAGDIADTTEPTEFVINFICIHQAEPSEQDKATPVAKLNKEVESGSDTVVPKDQEARDKERAHGVKVGESSEADALLEDAGTEEERSNVSALLYRIADNLTNGNLSDAKQSAKRISQAQLQVGFFSIGWSKKKSTAAALYLKNPTQETYQTYCDADMADDGPPRRDESETSGEAEPTPRPQGAGIKTQWKACFKDMSSCDGAKHLGPIEFQDDKNEWHTFEVMELPDRLVFGGAVNVGFLESGFIMREDGESTDALLQELLADLEVYYNDGPNYVSRIVVNDRM